MFHAKQLVRVPKTGSVDFRKFSICAAEASTDFTKFRGIVCMNILFGLVANMFLSVEKLDLRLGFIIINHSNKVVEDKRTSNL